MMRLFSIVALAALVAPAYADDSAAVKHGRHDFSRYCASCHGYAGDGRGKNADQFNAVATDFTRGVYKCRSTPTGALPTDDDLRRSIVHGLSDSGMPSFLALGPLQIEDLVPTLKSFSWRFAHEAPGQPIAVTAQTPNDAASVARGAALWSRLKCDNCHGRSGRGDGPGAATLHNDDSTPVHMPDLTRRSAYKCGSADARVFLSMMTGLDGTPMSGYAETITPEDAWDLVHFVNQLLK
jgi:cytochrome c oxidase cbb3-type subunit 2